MTFLIATISISFAINLLISFMIEKYTKLTATTLILIATNCLMSFIIETNAKSIAIVIFLVEKISILIAKNPFILATISKRNAKIFNVTI